MNTAEETRVKTLLDMIVKIAESSKTGNPDPVLRLHNLSLFIDGYIGKRMNKESIRKLREKGVEEA